MMKKHGKKIVIAAAIIGVFVGLKYSGLGEYLSLDNLKQHKVALQETVAGHYFAAVAVFIAVYIVAIGLSLPGAAILSLGGGLFFGVIRGMVYVNIGATTGATLAFVASRYFIGNWVQSKYQERLSAFNKEIEENGPSYLLSLRLIPAVPFFLINILGGLTKVRVKTFVWTTSVGIIPGSLAYTFAGKQLDTITSVKGIFSPRMLIALAVLILFSLSPTIIKKIRNRPRKHS